MATATASSLTELDSIVTSWATGGGSTVTEESVVTLADGNYTGTLNISGLSFPYRVWIQGRAPTSDGASPVRATGGAATGNYWYVNGTTNLGLRLIEFTGREMIAMPSGTTTNLWVDRCIIQGEADGVTNPATSNYSQLYVFYPQGTQNGLKVTNCLIRRSSSVLAFIEDGANQEITDNVLLDLGSDHFKSQGVATGSCKLNNNWAGKRMNHATGTHGDFIQGYPATARLAGEMRGNVTWRGLQYRDNSVELENFFFADNSQFNGTVTQNVSVHDSTESYSFFSSTSVTVDNNAIITVSPNNPPRALALTIGGGGYGTINAGIGSASNNFYFSNHSSSLDGTNIKVNPGSPGSENYALILPYYDTAPTTLGNIGQLTPVLSGGCHWNDSTPKGPYQRIYDIIVGGDHPGNVGWPVAEQWTYFWNNPAQDGDIVASTYTGSYNADGTNVGGAASPGTVHLGGGTILLLNGGPLLL